MISSFFHSILYKPFYNALVFLVGIIPGGDIGIAVIALTIIVRFILLPFTHKQIHTQRQMRLIEGEVSEIKKKFPDKQEQTKQLMELYQRHGINPLSGFLVVFIQIPILLALYYVFRHGIPFTQTDLYNFVALPVHTSFKFFGLIDLAAKNYVAAVLVGISQFIQIRLSIPPAPKEDNPNKEKAFGEELAKSMNTNMRFVMPVMITLIAASFPSVISLYWLTSNVFAICHELIVRHKARNLKVAPPVRS